MRVLAVVIRDGNRCNVFSGESIGCWGLAVSVGEWEDQLTKKHKSGSSSPAGSAECESLCLASSPNELESRSKEADSELGNAQRIA